MLRRGAVAGALVLMLGLAGPTGGADALDYVWWEGEDAIEHNFNNEGFGPETLDRPDELSGGDWLCNGGQREGGPVFARWAVRVPEAGAYHFYARKFWHHGPFRWRFNGGSWHTVRRVGLLDSVRLRKFIVANWVSLGTVELSAGEHVLEVRLLAAAGESAPSAFDCFLLSTVPLVPSGKLRPGQKTGKAMPGWWAFEPGPDPFEESPLDLRRLNDEVAGERGFLQVDGSDFVFENDAAPARFWAVCTGSNTVEMDRASVDYLARKLAKYGVNMIRVHSGVFDADSPDPAAVDAEYLEKLHYFVHAMKQQGIYTYLSIYFPLWFHVRPEYGLPGFEDIDNDIPFALLFFHPRMQEVYRSWVRGLMTTVNPYTGLPLADDPAVGIYEIINEDNYFFWTFTPGENIPYECLDPLEEEFAEWAADRYGSLEEAFSAWDHPVEGDEPAAARAGLMPVWSLTSDGLAQQPGARRRAGDQARFLTEHLRGFYRDTVDWLRNEIGVKCALVATNWTTADNELLGALDKYTNDPCGVMDRHGYWGPPHETDRGYTLSVGDRYRNRCGLQVPEEMSVRELQYEGHAHTVSEYALPMINRYRGDSVFLASVYGSLQGTDGFFFFAVGTPGWQSVLDKWPVMSPAILGQFPAAALMYRRGDVQEADAVIRQVLDLEDLFALKGSGGADPQNVDNLRARGIPPGGTATGTRVTGIDPLAYYVGRVVRTFSGDQAEAVLTDLSPYVDRESRTIRSFTGEARLDYGAGRATVNTPRAQGATGFLGRTEQISLDDLTIRSGSDYGSVLAVSLSEAPLEEASRVLLQVMTEETNYGWEAEPQGDMLRVVDLGGPPLNVREVAGEVILKRSDAEGLRVTALDPNGYPMEREVEVRAEEGRLHVTLEPDVIYYVIEGD